MVVGQAGCRGRLAEPEGGRDQQDDIEVDRSARLARGQDLAEDEHEGPEQGRLPAA